MTDNRLPEDYGEGQRQYDMALAALKAGERTAYAMGAAVGLGLALATGWYLLGAAGAVCAWWLALRPYKLRLKAAGDLWDVERRAALRQAQQEHAP